MLKKQIKLYPNGYFEIITSLEAIYQHAAIDFDYLSS
jgi:hypothetical protein